MSLNTAIDRNGIVLNLVEEVFGKKSPHAGKKFFVPNITKDNLTEVITWLGESEVVDALYRTYRKVFADIWTGAFDDNVDEATGKLNQEAFEAQLQSDWQDFTAGVVKLGDIEERIQELQDQQSQMLLEAPDDPTELAACMAKLKEIAEQIIPLKSQKAEISKKYEARAAKRKDRKVKTANGTEAKTEAAAAS